MPENLFAFGGDEYGNQYCFDKTDKDENGEYSVVFWNHETGQYSGVYANFIDWLNKMIEYNR
jgi:hypothetical protein